MDGSVGTQQKLRRSAFRCFGMILAGLSQNKHADGEGRKELTIEV